MDRSNGREPLGSKELAGKIGNSLLELFRILHSANFDITIYRNYHAAEDIRRDPYAWGKLDEAYTTYEEQANNCRRLWMRLRAMAEKEILQATKTGGTSTTSEVRLRGRSPSPLEYQSDPWEDEPARIGKVNQVASMDIDPVKAESDDQGPPTPPVDLPAMTKQKRKNNDAPPSRRVIITPSGPTSCRLAPIPKGVKLSVETTRNPVPKNPFTFKVPQNLVINGAGSERQPLNRTKRNKPDTRSSDNSFSSLQSTSQQATSSTTRTSVSGSSASDYWEPRRSFRPNDFHLNDDRLFGSLDCLGPPFHVNMDEVTHNTIPATWNDLGVIYGGRYSITPKISSRKLESHGFDHWMTPNMEFYPALPAKPGWPGLMLRLCNELEEWRPSEGNEFRVVIRKEQDFIEYVGQYEMVRLGDITGEEWKQQPAKVKKRWTQIIGGGRSWHDAIVNIALRKKLGREPSIQELTKFTTALPPNNYTRLAKELKGAIDQAFYKEEEVITVWGMKCVGYDFKFEKHLARSFKGIKPSPSGSPKRQKTATEENDPTSEDEDEGEGDDSESQDSPPPKRQRVAKGKAKRIRYDWTDAQYHDENRDKDYKPVSI